MPFGNNLSAVKMTGEEIIAALENGVSGVETGQGRFPQVSGMRFDYDSTKKGETIDAVTGEVTQTGERIVKVQVKMTAGLIPISIREAITSWRRTRSWRTGGLLSLDEAGEERWPLL